MSPPANLADALRQLADLSEVRGAPGEARDLKLAAQALDDGGPEAEARARQLARQNRLEHFSALPAAVHPAIRALANDPSGALRRALEDVPETLRELVLFDVVTTAQAAALARDLDIATRHDLELSLDNGSIEAHFGEPLSHQIEAAAVVVGVQSRPLTLGRGWETVEPLISAIVDSCPLVQDVSPAGDLRRSEPLVAALVLVGRTSNPAAAIDQICAMAQVAAVLHRGAARAIVRYQHVEIDVRLVLPDEFGTVLFRATGSRRHVSAVRQRRMTPGRVARDEHEVYADANLRFVPPELRQGADEIDAAAAGGLPALLTREDVRGDLHMHTTYSDGHDTLEDMVAACHALGYEYIAITDHSERAAASRTLSHGQIARQRDEIARLQERFPRMTILHGVEVDMMANGRLDFSDTTLAQFEIVLASLHDRAGHDGRRLTRRCVDAMRHPLVTVITHPANRVVGYRSGYDLDFEALYSAAVETGTALEIDGAPAHLDLDGEHARAAVAAGVTVTIDSDCHRAAALDRQMRMGIGTARRGWVEARHVLNARPLEAVRAFIASKRR